jgi:hypothetical protein
MTSEEMLMQVIDHLLKEKVSAAIITAIVAFIGILVGFFTTRWLEIRREIVEKKVLAGSLCAEIGTTVDLMNDSLFYKSAIEELRRRWCEESYTSPFPKLVNSDTKIEDFSKVWFPIFHSHSGRIGILGAKNVKNITKFYLLMNTVISDWIMYAQPDFWGHDHNAKDKCSTIDKHLSMLKKHLLTHKSKKAIEYRHLY